MRGEELSQTISASHDGTAVLFNNDTGEVLSTYKAHSSAITHAVTRGHELFTSSFDKTIRRESLFSPLRSV